mgnify:FL=1
MLNNKNIETESNEENLSFNKLKELAMMATPMGRIKKAQAAGRLVKNFGGKARNWLDNFSPETLRNLASDSNMTKNFYGTIKGFEKGLINKDHVHYKIAKQFSKFYRKYLSD